MERIRIVGAGLAGLTCARLLAEKGFKVSVFDVRNHIGGNCYDHYNDDGLLVHPYGIHAFHTNSAEVWQFLSRFTEWRYYQHRVLAYIDGAFLKFPLEATEGCYEFYTKKQWGKYADKIDAKIINRTKKISSTDDRYFADKYQAVPKHGYTKMFQEMMSHENISITLQHKVETESPHEIQVWTGKVDGYFNYTSGRLPYRSLRFESETFDRAYMQAVAQVNFPYDYDFTRTIEVKHLTGQRHHKTVLIREYPTDSGIPFYPIPCAESKKMMEGYHEKIKGLKRTYFVGRLAQYKYLNMDETILQSMEAVKRICT